MKKRSTCHKAAGDPKDVEASTVYFASVAVKRPEADATLPAKLERLLRHFHLEKWCAREKVPIKLHLGGAVGYTTIHPRLVRVIVDAVKRAGGIPYAVDGYFANIEHTAERGYTSETLGCPILPAGGPYDSHVVRRPINYRSFDEAAIFGAIWDAKCLINLSHVKGHGDCGYGGACKNLAMGCVDQATRAKIHALEGGIEWSKERCTFCGRCAKACDQGAINLDRKSRKFEIFFHHCRYCRHCISACPRQALAMTDSEGFRHFQEGMALMTKEILSSFAPARVLHINVLLNITQFCDCWGMSTPNIVPDIGILASTDIVAVETASLAMIKADNFIPGSLIGKWRLGKGRHLFERIHGKDPYIQVRALARHGLGQSKYHLREVD